MQTQRLLQPVPSCSTRPDGVAHSKAWGPQRVRTPCSRSLLHTGGGRAWLATVPQAGLAVEIEPRFYGLRSINEKEGSFEADIGLKVHGGQT